MCVCVAVSVVVTRHALQQRSAAAAAAAAAVWFACLVRLFTPHTPVRAQQQRGSRRSIPVAPRCSTFLAAPAVRAMASAMASGGGGATGRCCLEAQQQRRWVGMQSRTALRSHGASRFWARAGCGSSLRVSKGSL